MKQNVFRLCSIILVLALLLNMLPASAFANILPELFADTEETISTDTNIHNISKGGQGDGSLVPFS